MQRQRKTREIYFRQIDYVFYHEKDLREGIMQARLTQGEVGAIKVVNENGFSDPTARQAVKNLTPLELVILEGGDVLKKPESWLEVIDKTYDWCKKQGDNRYEVAKRRYYKLEDYRKTCDELNISNSTRRRLLELVQMYAALQAVQLGLIQV